MRLVGDSVDTDSMLAAGHLPFAQCRQVRPEHYRSVGMRCFCRAPLRRRLGDWCGLCCSGRRDVCPARTPVGWRAVTDPTASHARIERRTRLLAAAAVTLQGLSDVLAPLGERFAAADHELYLVGGSVRDAVLGRLGNDLDFTTDALSLIHI